MIKIILPLICLIFSNFSYSETMAEKFISDYDIKSFWDFDQNQNFGYLKSNNYFISIFKNKNQKYYLFFYSNNIDKTNSINVSFKYNQNFELTSKSSVKYIYEIPDEISSSFLLLIKKSNYFYINYNEYSHIINLENSSLAINKIKSDYHDFFWYIDLYDNRDFLYDLINNNIELYDIEAKNINDLYYYKLNYKIQSSFSDYNFDEINEIIVDSIDCNIFSNLSDNFIISYSISYIDRYRRRDYENIQKCNI